MLLLLVASILLLSISCKRTRMVLITIVFIYSSLKLYAIYMATSNRHLKRQAIQNDRNSVLSFSLCVCVCVLLFCHKLKGGEWRNYLFASKMQIHCSIWLVFCLLLMILLFWLGAVAVVWFAEFVNWTAFKLEWASWNVSNICQICFTIQSMLCALQKLECRSEFCV